MRDEEKQRLTKDVMKTLGAGGSRLDYVAAWFLKAGAYMKGNRARIAFVATNSITQGEQVPQLWPALFNRYGLEIIFAHITFPWGSEARGKAHVHVVIVGMADHDSAPSQRRLFTYKASSNESTELELGRIGPYLVDTSQLNNPHMVVKRERRSLWGLPKIGVGTKPVDGGHYILNQEEKENFLAEEPDAADLLRPFVGGREFINGEERWLLCPALASPARLGTLPGVIRRIRKVRDFREYDAGKLGKSLSAQPTAFHVSLAPESDFLVIPEVSSERREYVPIGYLKPPIIPSNQLLVVENANLPLFALLTSSMHMAWLRHIGGRLKSDYRYSSGLVYNTFPLPPKDVDRSKLEPLAQAVLDARAAHPGATLADLYDPDTMPPSLRRAHRRLDRAVDRLYRRSGFASERERVEHLLMVYEGMRGVLGVLGVGVHQRKNKQRKRV